MLWRQTLARGIRLDRLSPSPLAASLRIHDPPVRPPRPAEVGRRWLSIASLAPASISPEHCGSRLPDEGTAKPTRLDRLLRAIQCHDGSRIIPAFLQWVDECFANLEDCDANDADTARVDAALQELHDLPTTTFSEILRWLDPLENSHHDISHGLNLTLGQTLFTTNGFLVDEYGVRIQHKAVLDALRTVLRARIQTGRRLLVADFIVPIRYAGAASDPKAAMEFFGEIARTGSPATRNTPIWDEFMKVRFLIEPLYSQFDRTRVAVLPRRQLGKPTMFNHNALWRMDRIRYSVNAIKLRPFGRQREEPSLDMRFWIKKRGYNAYLAHWERSKHYGVLLNEELLCTTLVALSRSGSLRHIRGMVLWRGFRVKIVQDRVAGDILIYGGKRFRRGSPREPTERILNAIVESFGCMSQISTALRLLLYFSGHYRIPIPHETWSNLLNWAYVCTSKPFRRQRRVYGKYAIQDVRAHHVCEIWQFMTSEVYNVNPTFEDYGVYVKALIHRGKFRELLGIIREHVMPYYRSLEDEHRQIVFDEVLQEKSGPSHRRLQIEARKEHVWYQISHWMRRLFKAASRNKWQREGEFMRVIVPNLIEEFSEFLQNKIEYRTAQGKVCLKRIMHVRRFDWIRETRQTLPDRLGSVAISKVEERCLEGRRQDTGWPEITPMNVVGSRRKPRPRTRALGPAPESTDVNASDWWIKLEQELMT
ncbi:hypothetical protein FDECE_16972 [Fusarium decemcellulare]|nr:hypothetical protein FDECE_16972 [Fusarium decemcellulare]